MKKIFILLLTILPFISVAQHLSIMSIDTSNYPMMSARFIALDKKLDFVNDLKKEECKIIENGTPQKIIKIINPKVEKKTQSIVIIVDVSGSMYGTNLSLAKKAINEFINLTPFSSTELAIVTFNSNVFVNQDFTRDKNKLLNSVRSIKADGGTDYNVALFSNKNSALNLTKKRAGNEPSIIFLTDGMSSANYLDIANMANEQNAKIYTITLNMPMPSDLVEITELTNANYYENISTTDEAKLAYISILSELYNLGSEIYWESERSCSSLIDVDFTAGNNYKTEDYYQIYPMLTKGVFLKKQVVAFDPNSSENIQEIKMGAYDNATISEIKIKDSTSFEVKYNFKLPKKIKPGDFLTIKIVKKDNAELREISEVSVVTDVCEPKKIYIYNGHIANFIIPGSLVLRNPNGGEKFYSGDNTDITWINKTPNKMVNLFISKDNGKHYNKIKRSSSDKINWLIPGIQSDSCLVKVSLQSSPVLLNYNNINYKQIEVNSSGSKYIAIKSNYLSVNSTATGGWKNGVELSKTIKNFKLSPKSDKVVMKSDNSLYIFDIDTLIYQKGFIASLFSSTKKTRKIKHKKEKIIDYYYSPSGNNIIVFYDKNENFYVFDANKGKKTDKYKIGHIPTEINYNSNILSIITKDNKWIIWDLAQKKAIFELESKKGFNLTTVSQNGDYVAATDKDDNLIYWSKSKNDTIISIPQKNEPDLIKFNPKNNTLLCYEEGKNITLYDGTNTIFDYKPPKKTDITFIKFSPLGDELLYGVAEGRGRSQTNFINKFNIAERIMTNTKKNLSLKGEIEIASYNSSGNIAVFKTYMGCYTYLLPNETNTANDISDKMFKITSLKPQIADTIYMPDVFTQSNISFVDTSVFYNPNSNYAVIDQIYFEGKHQHKFGMISGIPPLGIPANSYKGVEFSFEGAYSEGIITSKVLAISGTDTLNSIIKIKTIKPPVKSITERVPLGNIKINKNIEKTVEIFENISEKDFIIDSIINWGPDMTQISINKDFKNKKIAPGEKIKLNFKFEGKNRGVANTLFFVYLKDMPKPLKIIAEGNVLAPYKINVKCIVTNKLDNSPLKIDIYFYNSDNNLFIKKTPTNTQGELSTKLPNELSYKIEASGTSSSDSKIVDLKNIFSDTTIIVNLQVIDFKDGMKYALENGKFDVKSSRINTETKKELDNLIILLNQSPTINIQIDGHTDNEGDENENIKLSEERANSVKKYMQSKGISQTRIKTTGYGASKPITTNETDEDKSKNRRIEITINVKND